MATVKGERHDEREISEMATKMMEENRSRANVQQQQQQQSQTVRQGQNLGWQQQQQTHPNNINNVGPSRPPPPPDLGPADQESKKGHFGWCEIDGKHVPFIFRRNGDRFTSVRMAESQLLSKFLKMLPPEVNSCHCIKSYYITEVESKLLNEINQKHSDCHFGQEVFTVKDLVVPLREAKELFHFLDLCHKKLVLQKSNASDRCGFFRINGGSIVPYTVRDGVKYVPLFYLEGDIEHLRPKSVQVDGWELAYLKFCCKVQGIKDDMFADDVCNVVALDQIKGHFSIGTIFEEYWPAKGNIVPVKDGSMGNWTQVSPQQPQQQQQQATLLPQPPPLPSSTPQLSSMVGGQHVTTSHLLAASVAQNHHSYQHLIRQGLVNSTSHVQPPPSHPPSSMNGHYAAAAVTAAASSSSRSSSGSSSSSGQLPPKLTQIPSKLTQIKEFYVENPQQPPYKLQNALIDQKIVPCINVRPFIFHELMMTLPDFVKYFCPDFKAEDAKKMLQDALKVVLYKGNKGHQEILKSEGKCQQFDPVPLLLVKDMMNYMPQMRYMLSTRSQQSGTKRSRAA